MGVTTAADNEVSYFSQGTWRSAASGEGDKTPGSGHFVLQWSCPEHKGHATLAADEWGQRAHRQTPHRARPQPEGTGE